MASKIKTFQSLVCSRIRHYFPGSQGRLPEVRLAGPCHGNFTPARISRSRPPCVIPILGAGTGRKYPPAGVMAQSVCHRLILGRMGALGTLFGRHLHEAASCRWSWRILPRPLAAAGNVFRIGYDLFKGQAGRQYKTPSLLIRIREGVAPNFFYLSIIFLSFLRTLTFRLWTVI